jgi:hypothetical protein
MCDLKLIMETGRSCKIRRIIGFHISYVVNASILRGWILSFLIHSFSSSLESCDYLYLRFASSGSLSRLSGLNGP